MQNAKTRSMLYLAKFVKVSKATTFADRAVGSISDDLLVIRGVVNWSDNPTCPTDAVPQTNKAGRGGYPIVR
jgi:hypothetical protein